MTELLADGCSQHWGWAFRMFWARRASWPGGSLLLCPPALPCSHLWGSATEVHTHSGQEPQRQEDYLLEIRPKKGWFTFLKSASPQLMCQFIQNVQQNLTPSKWGLSPSSRDVQSKKLISFWVFLALQNEQGSTLILRGASHLLTSI